MKTQITWKINSIEAKPTEGDYKNVVALAHWSCIGVNGIHSSSSYGCSTFSSPGENFIPYEELTEQQVLEWCFAGYINKDAIEDNIKNEVDKLINPPLIKINLPWIKLEPENTETVTENTESENTELTV